MSVSSAVHWCRRPSRRLHIKVLCFDSLQGGDVRGTLVRVVAVEGTVEN